MRLGEASIGSEVKPKRTIHYETLSLSSLDSISQDFPHGCYTWKTLVVMVMGLKWNVGTQQ